MYIQGEANLRQDTVEFRFTSNMDSLFLSNTDFNKVKVWIEMFKNTIPSSNRFYDATFKTWTLKTQDFNQIWKLIKATNTIYVDRGGHRRSQAIRMASIFQHLDIFGLKAWIAEQAYYETDFDETKPPINPNDFFYNTTQPTLSQPVMNLEQIEKSLCSMLSLSLEEFKAASNRIIMKKAAPLHPDFNNGDGSKFSTFTQLYNEYKQLTAMTK